MAFNTVLFFVKFLKKVPYFMILSIAYYCAQLGPRMKTASANKLNSCSFSILLMSAGTAFQLSATRLLKKFVLISSLPCFLLIFMGTAPLLVALWSEALSNHVPGSRSPCLCIILWTMCNACLPGSFALPGIGGLALPTWVHIYNIRISFIHMIEMS